MAARGAKPQPNSRRSLAKPDIRGIGAVVAPVTELDDRAQFAWDVVVADLSEQKVFQPSDSLMLTTFCQMYSLAERSRVRMEDLEDRLSDASSDIDSMSPNDYEAEAEFDAAREIKEKREDRISNAIKRERVGYLGFVKEMRAQAAEFALSPVARVRLGLMQLQGQQSLAELLGNTPEGEDDDTFVSGEVISE